MQLSREGPGEEFTFGGLGLSWTEAKTIEVLTWQKYRPILLFQTWT